jgi:hypothetical protein
MNSLVITIAIVLLPGLVASIICDKITVHTPKWGNFKYSIYSFLFGFFSYGLLQLLQWSYIFLSDFCNFSNIIFSELDTWKIIQNESNQVPFNEVFFALLLAPVVAFTSSSIVNHKIINRVAQKLNVSQKYGDENLFSFILNSKEVDWVYIRDIENQFTYLGRVVSYSECDSIQEIVLSEVDVYEYDTSDFLYSLPIIYLSRKIGTFTIEVPNLRGGRNNGKEENN